MDLQKMEQLVSHSVVVKLETEPTDNMYSGLYAGNPLAHQFKLKSVFVGG